MPNHPDAAPAVFVSEGRRRPWSAPTLQRLQIASSSNAFTNGAEDSLFKPESTP
jgi:hypothetical protein